MFIRPGDHDVSILHECLDALPASQRANPEGTRFFAQWSRGLLGLTSGLPYLLRGYCSNLTSRGGEGRWLTGGGWGGGGLAVATTTGAFAAGATVAVAGEATVPGVFTLGCVPGSKIAKFKIVQGEVFRR